jgi:beta-glucan synthesis-associated protein KRE6
MAWLLTGTIHCWMDRSRYSRAIARHCVVVRRRGSSPVPTGAFFRYPPTFPYLLLSIQVFSDEFEQKGRQFHDGTDPRWTAISKNDCTRRPTRCCLPAGRGTSNSLTFCLPCSDTNQALHYYSAENAVTSNGVLNITTELKDNTYKAFNETTKQFFADEKHVQSGMLQSWNKFCFIGGIVEISAKLPGNPRIGGLWPART